MNFLKENNDLNVKKKIIDIISPNKLIYKKIKNFNSNKSSLDFKVN